MDIFRYALDGRICNRFGACATSRLDLVVRPGSAHLPNNEKVMPVAEVSH